MKITRRQLKQIIKEEIDNGPLRLSDRMAQHESSALPKISDASSIEVWREAMKRIKENTGVPEWFDDHIKGEREPYGEVTLHWRSRGHFLAVRLKQVVKFVGELWSFDEDEFDSRLSDKLLRTADYVEYKVEDDRSGLPVLRKYYKDTDTDEWNEILGTEINKFEYDPRMYALEMDWVYDAMKRIYMKADTPIRRGTDDLGRVIVKGRGRRK